MESFDFWNNVVKMPEFGENVLMTFGLSVEESNMEQSEKKNPRKF